MPAAMNVAKRLIAGCKGTSLGTSAIPNIPFMAASGHDGMASGMYHKPDIPKQVTFKSQLFPLVCKRSAKSRDISTKTYIH